MPAPKPEDLPRRRHKEWAEHVHWWRWLGHSLQGGNTYRRAIYGHAEYAAFGMAAGNGGRPMPRRNLYRYKLEVPDWEAGDLEHPDYALRLERTPVPTTMGNAIETHLAEIYDHEIRRSHGDPGLNERLGRWWANVDGADTSADEWFPEVVMPYTLALGCLDLAFDRPAAPEGEVVATLADVERLGLDRCIARIRWPWNVLDWETHPDTGEYLWVLNLEAGDVDGPAPALRLRLWEPDRWTLVDGTGEVLKTGPTPTGRRVPQVRIYDRPDPQKGNVGRARYEAIAEIQREKYNKESEIVLSNARHGYPILQAPRSMLREQRPDASGRVDVPITPSRIVPMGEDHAGAPQGMAYLEAPQGPGDSIRRDQDRMDDQADRAARLTKPAGARGTGGNTVAQSGISKLVDERPGRQLCKQIARAGYKAEWVAAVYALETMTGQLLTPEQRDALEVVYPSDFDLIDRDEWTDLVMDFLAYMDRAASIPPVLAIPLAQRYARLTLPGRDDEGYEEIDAAIAEHFERRAAEAEAARLALADAQAEAARRGPQRDQQQEQEDPEAAPPEPQRGRSMLGRLFNRRGQR